MQHFGFYLRAASTKFSKRQEIVTGPRPPGTGDIKEAFFIISSVFTSPFGEPTSITTAPSLTSSLPIIPGEPVALIKISAFLACPVKSPLEGAPPSTAELGAGN